MKILTDQLFLTYFSASVFTVRVYGSDLQGGESAAAVLLTFQSHVCCQCLTVTTVRGTVTHFLGKLVFTFGCLHRLFIAKFSTFFTQRRISIYMNFYDMISVL